MAWAPFRYEAKVSVYDGRVWRRRKLRVWDRVPVDPVEVTRADLLPVVRVKPIETNVPGDFCPFGDEVFTYRDRLFRRFAPGGRPIPARDLLVNPSEAVAAEWNAWTFALHPRLPWHYERLDHFPRCATPDLEAIVQDGGWTAWGMVENDRAVRWAEAYARHEGSMLIVGDEVYIETVAPTWSIRNVCASLVYTPDRCLRRRRRNFPLAAKEEALEWRRLAMRERGKAFEDAQVTLCELAPDFAGAVAAIAIEGLEVAAMMRGQSTVAERIEAGLAAECDALAAMYRQEKPPEAWRAEEILNTIERVHRALGYRALTVWQRVQEFLEEAKPRLDRERARMADELSEDDLAALEGL